MFLRRLLETKNENNDQIHWESSHEVNQNIGNRHGRIQKSIDIEATVYALLAQIEIYRPITGGNEYTISVRITEKTNEVVSSHCPSWL